ncbi:MAG: CocE/NonD family hydrolase [Actinomycetota bacterium]|nr:CocE/NonD family hydrolase [Actinomycetota bacterium]
MRRPLLAVVLVGSIVASSCSDDGGSTESSATGSASAATTGVAPTTGVTSSMPPASSTAPSTAPSTVPPTSEALPSASFGTRPGTNQIAIVDARPDDRLEVVRAGEDEPLDEGTVDRFGSLLFRKLDPGDYVVRSEAAATGVLTVPGVDDVAEPDFYAEQKINPKRQKQWFGYMKARDGTTLSVNVVLPGGEGPFPTVVEYSGYAPSDPGGDAFSLLFSTLGYAYVGINMRGSGCSGGSWRFFEPAQVSDGYDAIETIAAQPWVKFNEVGMVGISYPGISQLFVGQSNPPSLAAITPLSVIDDSFRSTLYPGGMLNTGFALEWTAERLAETKPEGQEWTSTRIDDGDETCEDNQRLRLQNPDLVGEVRDNPYYTAELGDPLAPRTFVDQIDVPVFLAGSWQDEQTGGRFPTMLDKFTGSPHFYASLVNGAHTESLSAGVAPRLAEFLELYVARRTPNLGVLRAIAPILGSAVFGTDDFRLPDKDRFAGMPYKEALAEFESEPPIEVLFEQGGANGAEPGSPNPRFSHKVDAWPVPEVEPARWFLGVDGTLDEEASAVDGAVPYRANPDVLPDTFMTGADDALWRPDVKWDWRQNPKGTAASFATAPLEETTTMIGSASADLWITSDDDDTDLEVTLSEIRPDGREMYVQSGWLRASHRALDEAASSELQPVQTHLEDDAAPLIGGEPTPVRVEIFPFAHAFRAGSRLRLSVDAPGNNRAVWVFDTISDGERVSVHTGGGSPSSVVLPVVPGVKVPERYPPCSLKGEPCRPAP